LCGKYAQVWESWWREGGEIETMDDLVFCLDPQAHLVSKGYDLARWRHPERCEYHFDSQTCTGLRNLLGGDGGEEEEG
jgi:hypothetical protein